MSAAKLKRKEESNLLQRAAHADFLALGLLFSDKH